jgi:hypothetical protein
MRLFKETRDAGLMSKVQYQAADTSVRPKKLIIFKDMLTFGPLVVYYVIN